MNPISKFVRRLFSITRSKNRKAPVRRSATWVVEQLEGREMPAGFAFDLGTVSSPVATGYTGVPLQAYTSNVGYGWLSTSGMSAANRSSGTALTRDLHLGTDSTFAVDVPDGQYDVSLTLGDTAYNRDLMSVWAEGQQLASNVSTAAGATQVVTGRVTVSDGQLTLRLADGGGKNPRFALDAITVSPVQTTDSSTQRQTLFPSTAVPSQQATADAQAVELGVKFTAASDGYITGLRFYKAVGNDGTHVGNLWSASGVKLASATFTNESGSGWQEVTFATPVAIKAGTTYVASYFAPGGKYSFDNNYFSSARTSGDLTALANSQGGNGVYRYGSSGFPTQSFLGSNYWVDVVYQKATVVSPPPVSPPPAPTANAGADLSGNEGQGIALQGSATGTGLTYSWDFGDGTTAKTLAPTHAYADNGTYTARLTVTDSLGRTATDTAVVSVANVAPTATLLGGGNVTTGQSVTFSLANASDPSTADKAAGFKYSFDFNNDGDFADAGEVANGTASSAAFTFATAGTYTVHARITDKDGGSTDYTTSVTATAPSTGGSGSYSGILRTVYVSTTGSDSNSGSATSPWATLQHAADVAKPGDMIVVRAGTYVGFQMTNSGTAANPIVFKADPGVLVNAKAAPVSYTAGTINLEGASYIAIDGFTVTLASYGATKSNIRSVDNTGVIIRNNVIDNASWWGILTGFSENVLIENNKITNTQIQHGIYVGNSADNPIVRGNYIANSHSCGIQINSDVQLGGDGIITNAIVENNTLINNARVDGATINFDGVQNSVIRNNVIYGNHNGIALYQVCGAQGAKNNTIVGNTIVFAPGVGYFGVQITDGSTGNKVFDNILYRQAGSGYGSIGIDSGSRSGFQSDYNVVVDGFNFDPYGSQPLTLAEWRSQTGQDMHSIVATPDQLFVNWQAGDFRLKAGSPAINAGISLTSLTKDINGVTRPLGGATDIGAYESA